MRRAPPRGLHVRECIGDDGGLPRLPHYVVKIFRRAAA
jgi:hypothetical protein